MNNHNLLSREEFDATYNQFMCDDAISDELKHTWARWFDIVGPGDPYYRRYYSLEQAKKECDCDNE
jgi:hypothetical protein